jgi:hypothetical protein
VQSKKWNLTEISSPDYPGERLMVCFDPLLAEERCRKTSLLPQAHIGLKVDKVLNRFKMARHFELTMADGAF